MISSASYVSIGAQIAIIIGIIIIVLVTLDLYNVAKQTQEVTKAVGVQSDANGAALNTTLAEIKSNDILLTALVNATDKSAGLSLINQEDYFKPFLNQSFEKIYDALNISH